MYLWINADCNGEDQLYQEASQEDQDHARKKRGAKGKDRLCTSKPGGWQHDVHLECWSEQDGVASVEDDGE